MIRYDTIDSNGPKLRWKSFVLWGAPCCTRWITGLIRWISNSPSFSVFILEPSSMVLDELHAELVKKKIRVSDLSKVPLTQDTCIQYLITITEYLFLRHRQVCSLCCNSISPFFKNRNKHSFMRHTPWTILLG